MGHILLIHTVLSRAIAGITQKNSLIDHLSNGEQKNHGSFLHEGIDALLNQNDLQPRDIDAVAVTIGPGSYTGIRVGLSAAKGIAFALQIPVIPVSTLELLAATAIDNKKEDGVFMPLIKARLTEYFAGWYNTKGDAVQEDRVIDILQTDSSQWQNQDKVFYFGPEIPLNLINREGFKYLNATDVSASSFARIAWKKYTEGILQSAAEVNPSYLKPAYTTHSNTV